MTAATTEYSVPKRVERGVREVPVTPPTVLVCVHLDGNHRCVLNPVNGEEWQTHTSFVFLCA